MRSMRARGMMVAAMALWATTAMGAWTSFSDFNTSQFTVTGNQVALKWVLTNQVAGANVLFPTNAASLKVDLNQPYGDLNQAANFAFTGVVNISSTNYQSAVVLVGNTGGGTITIGLPSGVHYQGTWNCTNLTAVSFFCNAGRWTNAIAVPLW